MVFFTSGCVWCFRSGHFGAGNAGHHKKPAEEGDRRGVGKGEAPTSPEGAPASRNRRATDLRVKVLLLPLRYGKAPRKQVTG
ncbi:unnamed protein product [Rangifer tarandus platyrhynchus]|uniref:Uncharacterized protein n=1 Tax=Rangifer tarandus platyrhynchus TaxID=3082113 RepID=A0AC59YX52_RANTA